MARSGKQQPLSIPVAGCWSLRRQLIRSPGEFMSPGSGEAVEPSRLHKTLRMVSRHPRVPALPVTFSLR